LVWLSHHLALDSLLFIYFEIGFHYVAQVGLELAIVIPQLNSNFRTSTEYINSFPLDMLLIPVVAHLNLKSSRTIIPPSLGHYICPVAQVHNNALAFKFSLFKCL
jgi:hypothetical protein